MKIKKGQIITPDVVEKERYSSLKVQQRNFISYYLDPKSDTFGNATQSGLKAGYPLSYAREILSAKPAWLMENLNRNNMLVKAERNLDEALDIGVRHEDMGDRCLKATLFVAEKLGKGIYDKIEDPNAGGIKILILPQILVKKNDITTTTRVIIDPQPGTDCSGQAPIQSSEGGEEVRENYTCVPGDDSHCGSKER